MDIETRQRLRPIARDWAMRFHLAVSEAAQRGEGLAITQIDKTDEMHAFTATLSGQDAEGFLELYAEELNALTIESNAKASALEVQAIQDSVDQQNYSNLIVGLISVAVFVMVLLAFSGRR